MCKISTVSEQIHTWCVYILYYKNVQENALFFVVEKFTQLTEILHVPQLCTNRAHFLTQLVHAHRCTQRVHIDAHCTHRQVGVKVSLLLRACLSLTWCASTIRTLRNITSEQTIVFNASYCRLHLCYT